MNKPANDFLKLSDPDDEYGAFYKGNNSSKFYLPALLIVFIHGIRGDRFRTWQNLPSEILRQANISSDVLSFEYPAEIYERSSIERVLGE